MSRSDGQGSSAARSCDFEQGAALVIATLVTLVLTVLGISFLMIAQTENRIADNEKVSAQALYMAEAGVHVVQRWFDRPRSVSAALFAANLRFPDTAQIRRDQRRIDVDGDGPAAAIAADGNAAAGRPYYKQGLDRNGDGVEDLFDRPYNGDLRDAFSGTSAGPDIRIARSDSEAAKEFLDSLSETLAPSPFTLGPGIHARLEAIEIYAPPFLDIAGAWTPFGIATIAVTARIVRPVGTSEQTLAQRTIRVVVNEVPYRFAPGPLHSCGSLDVTSGLSAHWGTVTASGAQATVLPDDLDELPASVSREVAPAPTIDWLWGQTSDAQFATLKSTLESGTTIADPWFRLMTSSELEGIPGMAPQVFPPDGSGLPDHSNLFRNMGSVSCPAFDYPTWKAIAQSGGSDVHYFVWVTGDRFSENGTGPVLSLATITDGATGLYFFDTRTRSEPRDTNGDDVADNLTPPIALDADVWRGMRGLLYVNAETLTLAGSGGSGFDATFTYPGEPYRDDNGNGRYDDGEPFINLNFNAITGLTSPIRGAANDRYPASDASGFPPVRNPIGPRLTATASFWGVLYTAGDLRFDGRPRLLGSLVSGSRASIPQGSVDIYFDPALFSDWPPADWPMPRVTITRWETDP